MDSSTEVAGWFSGRLPDEWTDTPLQVDFDRDEILVVVTVPEPAPDGDDVDDAAVDAARRGRIQRFREDTRRKRIEIATQAEALFDRKVSWGAQCGDVRMLFTHLSIPAMTRLKLAERRVLDVLVETGVAKSRSHALAWCVRLVERHQSEWLEELREALGAVEAVRSRGPA